MQTPLTSMLSALSDGQAVAECLRRGLCFALYRLPGAEAATLVVSETAEECVVIPQREGFVVNRFAEKNCRFICADYQRTVRLHDENLDETGGFGVGKCACGDRPDESGSCLTRHGASLRADTRYLAGASAIIDDLRKDGGKTVYAHVFETETLKSCFNIFLSLTQRFPDAFVYLWHIAGEDDVWVGATPELLLSLDGKQLCTMALAGTRAAGTAGGWDDKNIAEQRYVADYIADRFSEAGIEPQLLPTRTLCAGQVEHICTPIEGVAKLGRLQAAELASRLSPTPAVCGIPVDRALKHIAEHELNPRRYYAGYSGPVSEGGDFSLFVTLRCARLLADGKAEVYAGGGLTAASNPDAEWAEAALKASALLKLLTETK